VADFARQAQARPGDLAGNRGKFEDEQLKKAPGAELDKDAKRALEEKKNQKEAYDQANAALGKNQKAQVQNGKLGVDLSLQTCNLRNQSQVTQSAVRRAGNRTCMEIGGVWIDEGYDADKPTLAVKAMSDAYFRILERHPEVKEVFRLGNHLVWVTPSGTALVIDANDGKDKLSDEEIDKLFVAKK
jgi:Ca-activated chloride channel family protein